MNCLRHWARYMRKGEVKGGGIKIGNKSASWILLLAKKGVLSSGALDLNTLCRGCSSHTTLVGLLYPGEDKSEKVCTGYKV